MEKEVLVLKLVSGEEVIGNVINQGHSYEVRKAYTLGHQLTPQGFQLMIKPYLDSYLQEKEGIFFDKTHVMLVSKPTPEMEDNYNKVTSPIDLPPKGLTL